jgi:hypothetical protein
MLLTVHVQVDLAKRHREDRLISRWARQRPFSTAGALRGNLAFVDHISTRIVIGRLHHQGMLDLTGHMIIWGGLFAHGDGSTGLMKVVFCCALPTVVKGFGANEKHFILGQPHFGHNCFWGVGV